MSAGFEDLGDAIRITRPEGISDARWAHHRICLQRIFTGHMPWCDDHDDDGDYCRHEERAHSARAWVHNGTNDGSVVVDFAWRDSASEDSLNASEAAAAAQVLERASQLVRLGNLMRQAEGEQ